jgi:hypothetical protein
MGYNRKIKIDSHPLREGAVNSGITLMINTAQFNLIAQSMPILPSYILADHLGSASITTNADGDKTSEVHYTP